MSCSRCGTTSKLLQCSGCKRTLYCNTKCQTRDWEDHKHHCSSEVELKLLSFNILADTRATNAGALSEWSTRRPLIIDVLCKANATVFGLQEVVFNQLNDIANGIPNHYAFTGGRNGKEAFLPIFYDKRIVTLRDSGIFWMSNTPNIPETKWSNSKWPYMCTWARFTMRDSTFRVYNLHLDVSVPLYRLNGVKLVLDHIEQYNVKEPVFIMGDFNSYIEDETMQTVFDAGFIDTHHTDYHSGQSTRKRDQHSTHHGTALITINVGRIDHIVYREGGTQTVSLKNTDTIKYRRGKTYPSDHFPIQTTVILD